MIELLLTSFPVIIRYFQLKRRGEALSVWNMKTAVVMWAVMAFALFLVIFYFHPKSYSGLVPFRTVSVVAQTSGPVTEVNVVNGQRVAAGDVLFRIEDASQKAAVAEPEAQFEQIAASETKAQDALRVAESQVSQVEANLAKLTVDLQNAQTLVERNVGRADDVRTAQAALDAAQAELSAAQAQLDAARSDLEEGIPAQRRAAETKLESAKVARSFTDGTVTQLAMGVGSPASTLILSPAMVIIPERSPETPVRIVAGFSQVALANLHEGMPAEIACDANANLSFRNAILPARVVAIQPAIATGQVVPGAKLLDPNSVRQRGSVLVYMELIHPAHEEIVLDGAGCIVQTYRTDLPGLGGHLVAATGVVKAAGVRLKVWGSIISGVGLAGGGGH